jgi:hypothetical protein
MTIEEAHDIAYEKFKCAERWWIIGIGDYPVIYKRMDIRIG